MYPEEGGAAPADYSFSDTESLKDKIVYHLEGLIPLILILVIAVAVGHKLGFWSIPFLGQGEPVQMLIIGETSQNVIDVLNENQDLVRYTVKSPQALERNPREQLAEYKIVLLDQSLEVNKEVSRALGEAITAYVDTGGNLITVKDSGIRRKDSFDVLGWEATFGNTVPVRCDVQQEVPSCLNPIAVRGKIYQEKKHPIMTGIEVVPADPAEGLLFLETFNITVNGKEIAYIKNEGTTSEYYPAIVEGHRVIGKSVYFNYDPGKTRGVLENTIKYMR